MKTPNRVADSDGDAEIVKRPSEVQKDGQGEKCNEVASRRFPRISGRIDLKCMRLNQGIARARRTNVHDSSSLDRRLIGAV
jgi:hypothetical protein